MPPKPFVMSTHSRTIGASFGGAFRLGFVVFAVAPAEP
jgi:hypothetical protein